MYVSSWPEDAAGKKDVTLAHQRERFPHVISVRARLDGEGYLSVLKRFLPEFLAQRRFALAFYNAGSDVCAATPSASWR